MNADSLSAIIFAAAAILFGWRRFNRGLATDGFSAAQRRWILGIGAAVILLCLSVYLGWL